jgi:hypothetical protein
VSAEIEWGSMPVMPFESEGQREAYERLRPPLQQLFPDLRERIHAIGYVYEVDGTTVTSTLAPWGDDTMVANRCYLAGDVPISEALLRELAAWTESGRSGFFGVDGANNVYFEHQLPGSTATKDTLDRSIHHAHATAMARKADVRTRFGGGDL